MVALTVYLKGKGLTSGWCVSLKNSFSYNLSIECIVLFYDWVRRWLVTCAWPLPIILDESMKTYLPDRNMYLSLRQLRQDWLLSPDFIGLCEKVFCKCIMIFFFLNFLSIGWSSFCFTEAGLCRHWQRNVRTCIWGVCIIICTCKCWNSKWNLGLNGFNLKFKSQFLLFPNPNVTIHDHESSSLLIRT